MPQGAIIDASDEVKNVRIWRETLDREKMLSTSWKQVYGKTVFEKVAEENARTRIPTIPSKANIYKSRELLSSLGIPPPRTSQYESPKPSTRTEKESGRSSASRKSSSNRPRTATAVPTYEWEKEQFQKARRLQMAAPASPPMKASVKVYVEKTMKERKQQKDPPKSKFAAPYLSSHEYGWRPSLEIFGVTQRGRKPLPSDIRPTESTF